MEADTGEAGPVFHVRPVRGWLNDPNGLIWHAGRFHCFFQHVARGASWDWGLVWGHAVSDDLAHWRRLPPALAPTPGGADADGCWSGCCTLDERGAPALLYTGVRLHSTAADPGTAPAALPGAGVEVGRLPAPDAGAGPLWTEAQCAAELADPCDGLLTAWRKLAAPLLPPPAPPAPAPRLLGWRDPFVFLRPSDPGGDGRFHLVVGAGAQGSGGVLLAYSSPSLLRGGWRCDGPLCAAADVPAERRGGTELGLVWECPLLAPLPGAGGRWLLAVSPYPAAPPHSPSNPVLYFVGQLDAASGRFDFGAAEGPLRLDLGDLLYAPNVCRAPAALPAAASGASNGPVAPPATAAGGAGDGPVATPATAAGGASDATQPGRLLLWAWLQERRPPGAVAGHSGCLTLPRELSWSPALRRLRQGPPPELAALRRRGGWRSGQLALPPDAPVALDGLRGSHLEVRLTLRRGTAAAAGLRLRAWAAGAPGGATMLYSWAAHELTVAHELPPVPAEVRVAALARPLRQALETEADAERGACARLPPPVGGRLAGEPQEAIELAVFLDGSALEVFTGSGEALSTRVYRGSPPACNPGAGLSLVAAGGVAALERGRAWELGSAYVTDDGKE